MSNSLCKSAVFKTYQDVIADVIQNIREHFLEDGIDETVLQELKSLWESKLAATKAVEEVKELDKIMVSRAQKLQQQQQQQHYLNQIAQQQSQNKQLVGQVPPNNHIPQGIAFPEWKRVPVQLTIPAPPGCGSGDQRVLGIEVPEVFLQGHHLKSILTGPIISATLNLPLDAAAVFLQDQVNNAFLKHQQSTNIININSILQTDGCSFSDDDSRQCGVSSDNFLRRILKKKEATSKQKSKRLQQSDGTHSSSDDYDLDDDEDDNENGDENEDLNDDIEEEVQDVAEDEPLNSEDDVSDADGIEDSFETENVIVCQFDKITRARNRWKFHLKDGIMNLNGEDYVFQKANGDAEW